MGCISKHCLAIECDFISFRVLNSNYLSLPEIWSTKRKQTIHYEVPTSYNPYCKQFGEVKVHLKFIIKKKNYKIIDCQTCEGNQDEWRIFSENLTVFTMKSPNSVPEIIWSCCKSESCRIGNIFVNPELFL